MPSPKAATKLQKAAQTTACPGDSTRVETTVAIEFAASWKPLMKSNSSATRMIRPTVSSAIVIGLGVLDDDALEHVGDVLASVGGFLEDVEDLLPLHDRNR